MATQLPLFGTIKRELSSALAGEKKTRAEAKAALTLLGRASRRLEQAKKRAGKGKKAKPPTGTSAEAFEALIRAATTLGDRQMTVEADKSLAEGRPSTVTVRFVNLPRGMTGSSNGGAEWFNNRVVYMVEGFAASLREPAPGKVSVKELGSFIVDRKLRLRARSGTPAEIAKYLGAHISKLARTIPPNFTHSKPPSGY